MNMRSKNDPLAPSSHISNTGGGGLDRGTNPELELGEVLAYHAATHSASVRTLGKGGRLLEVAMLKKGSGDYELLDTGTTVVISWGLGFMPLIIGVVDLVGQQLAALGNTSITNVGDSGTDDPLQPAASSTNYRPADAPSDLGPGDYAKVGDRNQTVSILKGGVAQIGSPNAQLRSFGMSGLLQLIGQRMQGVSDFGTWNIKNDEGKVSFVLRAGSDQSTETGYDENHWTIRLDLGAEGDVFTFETTNTEGHTLFRMHVNADGGIEFFGNGGCDITSGDNTVNTYQKNVTTRIRGESKETVDRNVTKTCGASETHTVVTDYMGTVGNDRGLVVNRHNICSIGGNRTEVIAGGATAEAKPGNVAYGLSILNGSWNVDIGDPKKGANPLALAGWNVTTSAGDINLKSGAAFKLESSTRTQINGRIVELNGANSPLPMWQEFRVEFASFLSVLMAGLAAGTVGSPAAQQLVGFNAALPKLTQFVSTLSAGKFDSLKVRNG